MILRRALFWIIAVVSLVGCSLRPAAMPNLTVAAPEVDQTGRQNGWLVFSIPPPGIGYYFVAGHDDAMWGTSLNGVVRIAMDGSLTTFPHPGLTGPIAPNPDGNMYAAESYMGGYAIARLTPSGSFNDMPLPTGFVPYAITSGSDGNLWISGCAPYIIRMTASGVTTTISGFTSYVCALSRAPDKNIWTVDFPDREIWRVSISDLSITAFNWPAPIVTEGDDGALWGEYRPNGQGVDSTRIDRIDMQGNLAEYEPNMRVNGVVAGPNKNLYWYGDNYRMWSFNEVTHAIASSRRFVGPCSNFVAPGPDGQVWQSCVSAVYVDIVHPIITKPYAVTVGVGLRVALSVSEPNGFQKTFSAVSNNTAIASVTTSDGKTFSVTGVAVGKTTITVSDKIGNSLDVSVTVN